jgi:nicotinate-nucleotide adenylyltransferase
LHIGHLAIAEEIRERMHLQKVIFVPSYMPPHKSEKKLAAADSRFKMVKEAIKDNPFFSVSDSEIKRRGKSYSIDTLRYFKKKYGKKTRLYFIIGSDSLPELKRWREIQNIFKLAGFVVVNRPGFGVSSTQIRQRLAQGKSIQYLVPGAVAKIIRQQRLYPVRESLRLSR